MSLNSSLAEHIGSLPEATPTTSAEPAPTENLEAGQPQAEAPEIKPLGKDTQEAQPTPEAQAPFQLSLAPDTVIGTAPDGKPITAAEVHSGYLRQADYTRKTQEMSDFRKTAEPAVQFVTENWKFIEGLSSDDPQVKLNTVLDIAKSNGVDLSGLSKNNRERDERGRFTPGAKEASGYFNLDQYEEGSEAYDLASAANAAIESLSGKVDEIAGKFDGFLSNTEKQQQQQQAQSAMQGIAREWTDAGMQKIDIQGAMSLVGKPMDHDAAMIVHHFEAILAHQLAAAQRQAMSRPNEPGSVPGSGISPAGVGLHDFVSQRVR